MSIQLVPVVVGLVIAYHIPVILVNINNVRSVSLTTSSKSGVGFRENALLAVGLNTESILAP